VTVDVQIEAVNQLWARLDCDSGLGYEIAEEFSFFVPGYKFMPSFKNGRWDGRIKLFNRQNHQIYRGLLPQVCSWLTDQKYTFDFLNKKDLRPQISYPESWLADNWKRFGKLEPMTHQVQAIEAGLKLNQALVLSPTSSGKSYIIYLMTRFLLEQELEGKILIITPRIGLVRQLVGDFKDYEVDAGWTAANCHEIFDGAEKRTDKEVVVSTWQSIFRMPKTWFAQFSAVFVDEAHEADASSMTGIIDKMPMAPVRIGLTGTLDGTVMHEYEMNGRFGPLLKFVSTKDLMDRGVVSNLKIKCLRLKYSKEEIEIVRHLDYQGEIDFLITNEKRNQLLCNLALDLKGNTLMLFNYIERHGKAMHDLLLKNAKAKGKKIHYIDGSVLVAAREEIRQILEREDDCILLATFGTLSTGTNIKNLHNAIFCHPYKARTKILQSIGRILRKAAGKAGATLFDVGDDLAYTTRGGKEKINTTMRHFIERLQSYESEQFPYKIVTVPITG
jgi:superfamily II DNA or RNA helicase